MKRKRICAWFITLAMLLTMLPSALAASFADTRGHWAEDAISRWSDRGVIQGHNGDFEPDSAITRADMAVIIDRIMDYQTKAENKFSDLDNAYYKDPILRVAQAGDVWADELPQPDSALPEVPPEGQRVHTVLLSGGRHVLYISAVLPAPPEDVAVTCAFDMEAFFVQWAQTRRAFLLAGAAVSAVLAGRARRTGRTLYANTWSGWPGWPGGWRTAITRPAARSARGTRWASLPMR